MKLGFRRVITAGTALSLAFVAACSDSDGGVGPTPSVAAPTGVTATATSATSVRVQFGAVTGATAYVIQRAEGTTGDAFQTVADAVTAPTYDDNGVKPETDYRYRVQAKSGAKVSDFSAIASVRTPAGGPKVAVIDRDITADRTLYADTLYTLKGFIKVGNGATLTIQPGTVIQGDYETVGSSLFILRGAKIDAQGTAEKPIVFTSSRPEGQRMPGDWGGLILIGNGIINRGSPVILEGTGTGPSNPQQDYSGGTDNNDSSGTLRYVRVEFAGYATAPDAELNSFTFAAVGNGTKVEYLQALAGLDDHFEFFGGAVDTKYLVSYESGDDHFDTAEGHVGRHQFLIAYQSKVLQPRPAAGNVSNDPQGIENDGCAGANCLAGQDSQPYNLPMFANFTLVGTGPGVVDATSGGIGMMLRRGTGGHYVNGVLARWPRAAVSLRDASTKQRIDAGDLQLRNLLLAENGAVFQPQTGSTVQSTVDLAENAIEVAQASAASLFLALPLDPSTAAHFDWTPSASSPARSGGLASFSGAIAQKAGTVVTPTAYRGAADPAGPRWWQGWTHYADN